MFYDNLKGLGSGILFTYPDIGVRAGIQGVLVYALASALPIFAFAFLTPLIRKHTPGGFLLTEWARERFGVVASLYLSILTYVCSVCNVHGLYLQD